MRRGSSDIVRSFVSTETARRDVNLHLPIWEKTPMCLVTDAPPSSRVLCSLALPLPTHQPGLAYALHTLTHECAVF